MTQLAERITTAIERSGDPDADDVRAAKAIIREPVGLIAGTTYSLDFGETWNRVTEADVDADVSSEKRRRGNVAAANRSIGGLA